MGASPTASHCDLEGNILQGLQQDMSEQERETEEDEGVTSDTAPMLPRRRSADYDISVPAPILATRGLRTLVLSGQALLGFLLHLLLPGTVFLLVLLPAAAIVYLGFLCHSRVSSSRWLFPGE